MAHKSKTQRAKAAITKANKKDRQLREEAAGITSESDETSAEATQSTRTEKNETKPQSAVVSKQENKPKKVHFQFLHDVRVEMKRVTWPDRTDVMRWSWVVIGALAFFGVYVALLDNVIITPALVALTGLGA